MFLYQVLRCQVLRRRAFS